MRISRHLWRFSLLSRSRKHFCTTNKPENPTANSKKNGTNSSDCNGGDEGSSSSSSISRQEAYKKLDNLDFMTATNILLTTPPKRKKFGFDFHLVQFFFTCLPSFAVFLVAQYARSEMRRMEAEMEVRKKAEEEAKNAEEEAKAKEIELKAAEERKETSDPQLSEVKERLDKLEEAIKEIVVESKKESSYSRENSEVDKGKTEQPASIKPNSGASDAIRSIAQDTLGIEASQPKTSPSAGSDASKDDKKSS